MAESEVPLPAVGMAPTRVPFPQTSEDLDTDPRVSFSTVENKYILEDDDGSEWEFDDVRKRWIPLLDEALLEKQRQAYAVEGVDDTAEPAKPQKKRKIEYSNEDQVRLVRALAGLEMIAKIHHPQNQDNNSIKKPKKTRPAANQTERKNTAVYVTSLPLDATVAEVQNVFSKCGVIAEEIDRGKPRIKLYTDEAGNFKGDALVVYFKAESVSLAVQILDDTDFRLGQEGPTGKMRVKEAERSYKKVQDRPAVQKGGKDQKKIIRKTQKLNNKLADWDDDDPSAIQETSSRWDKVVILKHMFTLEELQEDPAAILDIKEDIRDECSKLGEVTNVQLFDKELDGVASVRFGNTEAANACIRLMDGRMFAGQKVEAYIADGTEKFKKTSEKKTEILDSDEEDGRADEEGRRLDQFGQWLETEAS